MTSKDEAKRTRAAIRCAKAAMFLYTLASSRKQAATMGADEEEKVEMQREMGDLRRRLAREKAGRERMRLCGLMELLLVVTLILLISTFLLILFLSSIPF
ncbi:PREDICTED: uncharacterized protein LOC104810815 [Tarenaya hassleriana]|uniref:uncharacterized protein LOC104810815 n=1 Tax=Tarenaya hassleriana TaxID=28532 RepID=UPI00053C7923|nr:PREDICTED: uncharacterized protein LOC104810815 [Tarenaya hassleriana]